MKILFLLVIAPLVGFAQLPIQINPLPPPPLMGFPQLPTQVNVTLTQRPEDGVWQALRDAAVRRNNAAQIRIAQQAVDIELERLRFEERQAETSKREMVPDNLAYRQPHTDEPGGRVNQDVENAFNACRALHDDCDKLSAMMNVIAGALRPDWTQLTMLEYVECLYVIARNAIFGEHARAMLSTRPVQPQQLTAPAVTSR